MNDALDQILAENAKLREENAGLRRRLGAQNSTLSRTFDELERLVPGELNNAQEQRGRS
jgi:regulator of replication initiation timing